MMGHKMEKISEKVRAALEREEKYLLEVQKAVEQQLAVLKAEQVVLERQIGHHEHQELSSNQTTGSRAASSEPSVEGESDTDDLPQLRLEIADSVQRCDYEEEEDEEMED